MSRTSRRPRHWTYAGEKMRVWVLRRDRRQCQIRGPNCEGYATTVDHILARSAGGTEHPSNLRAACETCNGSKGSRPAVAHSFRDERVLERPLRKIPPLSSSWEPKAVDYSPKDGET